MSPVGTNACCDAFEWSTGAGRGHGPAAGLTKSRQLVDCHGLLAILHGERHPTRQPLFHLLARFALGLADDVRINPSGGALTANPMFSAGLNRIGEAASRIWSGDSDKTVAHTTSGPVLQHNLVTVLDSKNGSN